MLSVAKAQYREDFQIEIEFSDKRRGVVDLKSIIFQSGVNVFSVLQDNKKFANFKVDYTICWGDSLDIAPEFLYFKAFEKDVNLQQQFRDWGYAA